MLIRAIDVLYHAAKHDEGALGQLVREYGEVECQVYYETPLCTMAKFLIGHGREGGPWEAARAERGRSRKVVQPCNGFGYWLNTSDAAAFASAIFAACHWVEQKP